MATPPSSVDLVSMAMQWDSDTAVRSVRSPAKFALID